VFNVLPYLTNPLLDAPQAHEIMNSARPTPQGSIPPMRRAIRRHELRKIVPLANTTIYELECRGEFPRRFYLTPRCVVWDLDEVYAWLDRRKQPAEQARLGRAPSPDVRLRRRRPLKSHPGL
jgi:prophage regulatory protein